MNPTKNGLKIGQVTLMPKFWLLTNLLQYQQGTGRGHSWIDIGPARLISCYISPNSGIEDLTDILEDISCTLRDRTGTEIIIGGDFNAKSWGWGCNYQDQRGKVVAEWIESNNLVIQNRGNTPTFKRGTQESIIDITLSSESTAARVTNWKVLDDVESLSLHQYISFEINNITPTIKDDAPKGWKINTFDKEAFRREIRGCTADDEKELIALLERGCNKSMKKRGNEKKREVYWWNENISDKRKACNQKRKKEENTLV